MKLGFLKKHGLVTRCLSLFSKWFGLSIKHKKGNKIQIKKSFFKRTKCIFKGTGNSILIGDNCFFEHCTFNFFGSENTIVIGDNCRFVNVTFWIEDSGNKIIIGNRNSFCGLCQIAAIEGTTVTVGDGCLVSSNVYFRTGDSHSITNLNGERINPSKDITIGNHVWIGTNVYILKNTFVNDDCVIGACSLLNKKYEKTNCVIAGNPASIRKEQIGWDGKRF